MSLGNRTSTPESLEPELGILPRARYLGRGIPVNRFAVESDQEMKSEFGLNSNAMTNTMSFGRARILEKMRSVKDPGLGRDEEVVEGPRLPDPVSLATPSPTPNHVVQREGGNKSLEVVFRERVNGNGRPEGRRGQSNSGTIYLPRGMGMKDVDKVYDAQMKRHTRFEPDDECWDD